MKWYIRSRDNILGRTSFWYQLPECRDFKTSNSTKTSEVASSCRMLLTSLTEGTFGASCPCTIIHILCLSSPTTSLYFPSQVLGYMVYSHKSFSTILPGQGHSPAGSQQLVQKTLVCRCHTTTVATFYCFPFLEEIKIIHEVPLSWTLGSFSPQQGQISRPEFAAEELNIG